MTLRLLLAPLAACALASCHSGKDKPPAALYFDLANRTEAAQTLEKMWVSKEAVRIERDLGPDGAPKHVTLARTDLGVVWEIDPAKKEYSEYRFDWLSARMDKGDAPLYEVMPYENAEVAGHSAEGFILTHEGRSVGQVWIARDLETEISTAMGWRVYHRFRGFTNVLRRVPGVIVKQELKLPDYAYRCEAMAISAMEESPKGLFELPPGFTPVPAPEK